MSTISSGTTSTTTLIHSGDTTGSLVFKTNDTGSGGTTAMTIDTSQRVLVGTNSAVSIVTIGDGSAANKVLTINGGTGSGFGAGTVLQRNSTQTAIFSTDSLIGGNADGASVWSSEATRFYTGGSNERMRIDSSGNLLVGATSTSSFTGSSNFNVLAPNNGSASAGCFRAQTTAGFNLLSLENPNGQVGRIQTNGSATSYLTSSDYRLKEDIAPMTGALNKVLQLKPVTFKWKVDSSVGQGFIAHELQEVVSDCVGGEKDAVDADGNPVYQGIDTSFLVATLVAAIQEQQALITSQAQTITALTARIAALEGK